MSTKHELEKQSAQLQAQLDKLNKTIASMKSELPEGFIPFQATPNSKCPCHEKDIVLWATGYAPAGVKEEHKKEAGRLNWKNDGNRNLDITGYKIVVKYVEPLPMQYSEIPVGQWFMWSNGFSDEDSSVYMKIPEHAFKTAVCIKSGNFYEAGKITHFSEELRFYSVKNDMTRGELLTVEQPPQPVEDEFFMGAVSGVFYEIGYRECPYIMGRRPDGGWFILKGSGEREYFGGGACGKRVDYDKFVKDGVWVQTTPEQAFKK